MHKAPTSQQIHRGRKAIKHKNVLHTRITKQITQLEYV